MKMKIWCFVCLFLTIFNSASFSNTSDNNDYITVPSTSTTNKKFINNEFKNKSNFNHVDKTNNMSTMSNTTIDNFTLSTTQIVETKFTTKTYKDLLLTKYEHITTDLKKEEIEEYTTLSDNNEHETTENYDLLTTNSNSYDDLITFSTLKKIENTSIVDKLENTTFENTYTTTEISVNESSSVNNFTEHSENNTMFSSTINEIETTVKPVKNENKNLEINKKSSELSALATENTIVSEPEINMSDTTTTSIIDDELLTTDSIKSTDLTTSDTITNNDLSSSTESFSIMNSEFEDSTTIETQFDRDILKLEKIINEESTVQNLYSSDNPTTERIETTTVSSREEDLLKSEENMYMFSTNLTTTPQYYRQQLEIHSGEYLEEAINAINNSEILETTSTTYSSSTITESTTVSSTTTQNPCEDESITVQNLSFTSDYFSIFVNWNKPEEIDCKFNYYLKWNGNENEYETNSTNYTIEGLLACEKYNISVGVMYGGRKNKPLNETIETKETIEAVELESKVIDEETNTFLIFWKLPENVEKCLIKYHIKHIQNDKLLTEFEINVSNITFPNLNGCINNTYVVSARSKNFTSPENSTYFLKLIENSPPINTEVIIEDDYVLTNWKFGQVICKPEQFFVRCERENSTTIEQQGTFSIDDNILVAKIVNIIPYKKYFCRGYIENKETQSNCSETVEFTTKSKAPSDVLILNTYENTDHSLHIEWSSPEEWNGKAELYNVSLEFIDLNYNLTENCVYPEKTKLNVILRENETDREFDFKPVEAAAKYKIGVSAKSDRDWGNVTEQIFDTKERSPEKPTIKALHLQSWSLTSYNVTLNFTWTASCKSNGELKLFKVQLIGYRDFDESIHTVKESVNASGEENYYFIFKDLKPEYNYTVILQAFGESYFSEAEEGIVITPAGIPEKPEIENMKKPNTSSLTEPWKTAIVYISDNLFNDKMGKILYYAIIVAPEYCIENPKYQFYETNKWPVVTSDNSSCVNDTRAYQATEKFWNPFNIKRGFKQETFTLGKNENCKEFDCNRPLQPNTKYFVKIRGFTQNGFSDTQLLSFQTEALLNDVPVGLIVGLIVGILAIAFVIATVLFYTKGKINFTSWPRMESPSSISPAPLPVSIKKFRTHYTKMIENPGKIKNEFQLLSTISSDVTLSTKTALLPVNRKKNRYINILPYDQTRVQLTDTTTNSSDFINASFIKGYSGTNEYIATQGPIESTCPAFWQMMLEQNIKLIVMLTQFVESGKDKCYKYFPDLKEEYELINDIRVQCIEEELLPIYNRRIFKILKGSTTKKVTHIQFNLWPDFGVPDEVHHMIDFCEIIKDIKMKKPSIIVMHCSAGVGRTGTLIAVDILMQTIRDKRKVDIFGTVLNLRKQRMNMVQSEYWLKLLELILFNKKSLLKQYEFLYKCVNYVISHNNSSSKTFLTQISESNML